MATLPARLRIAPGPSRHVYDVIVIGGQLGGAVAAALLAKRGYRVLLVEHDGMGHGYEHGGYLLPYAPFVAPPLRAMPSFDEVLVELGLNTAVQRALKPHAPDLQLVLEKHRVNLHHEEPRRLAELAREFGEASAKMNSAVKSAAAQHEQSDPFFKSQPNLHPDGLLEKLGLKRLIKRHPGLAEPPAIEGDEPPMRLLSGLLPFVSYVNEPTEPLARTRPLSQALMAPNRYPGGREGLREVLCRKLADLGGDLLGRESSVPRTRGTQVDPPPAGRSGSESWVVEELTFEGTKLVGVQVVQSENAYRASCVIAATDSGALRRLVPDKKKHRALSEQLDLVSTPRFLFTVNWVLHASKLPRGMGDLLLVETAERDLGPLLIQVHVARRPSGTGEEDERTVCAGAFVRSSVRDLGEDHMRSLAERISRKLEELMPFSREHVKVESAPYLDAGGVRGSRLLPHPLYEIDTQRLLGVTGLPQRTPVKNLFLASREVFPGLGLEGEILAGAEAARLVQESMKKSDPLKR